MVSCFGAFVFILKIYEKFVWKPGFRVAKFGRIAYNNIMSESMSNGLSYMDF